MQLHELPRKATVNMVKESFRLLRAGGILAIIDQAVSFQNMLPLIH